MPELQLRHLPPDYEVKSILVKQTFCKRRLNYLEARTVAIK